MKLPRQLQYFRQIKYIPSWQSALHDTLLTKFPGNTSLVLSFGPGLCESSKKKDVGVLFVVNDAVKWHRSNYKVHESHYCVNKSILNIEDVEELVNKEDHGIFFRDKLIFSESDNAITYGVLPLCSVVDDLTSWELLCAAGIFHKPVNLISYNIENSFNLIKALQKNLFHATLVSLLLLPDAFTENKLYSTVLSLSQYSNAFSIDEYSNFNFSDENNVRMFEHLYHPVLSSMIKVSEQQGTPYSNFIYWDKQTKTIEQDKSELTINEHLKILPLCLQTFMCRVFDSNAQHIRDVEEIMKSIARYPEVEELVRLGIREIIKESKNKVYFV